MRIRMCANGHARAPSRRGTTVLLAMLAVLGITASRPSNAQVFTGTLGDLSARVAFSQSGGTLTGTFSNLSTVAVTAPGGVLTAVFFDIVGDPNLNAGTIALSPGSFYVAGSPPAGHVLGSAWAFRDDLAISGLARYGVSASGLGGTFGTPDTFAPSQNGANGADYGLVGTGGISGQGILNQGPLIQNGVVFTLTGVPAGATIRNVFFQYGTSLTETRFGGGPGGPPGGPDVPEPGLIPVAAAAVAGLLPVLRRRKR